MKNTNIFHLKFGEKHINLTGEKYGMTIFKTQVEHNIDYMEEVTIIFPCYVKNISTSFVQGFFKKLVSKIGIKGINEKVNIISTSIPNIKMMIMEKLNY